MNREITGIKYAVKCINTGTIEFTGTWEQCSDYIKAAKINKWTKWKSYRTQAA